MHFDPLFLNTATNMATTGHAKQKSTATERKLHYFGILTQQFNSRWLSPRLSVRNMHCYQTFSAKSRKIASKIRAKDRPIWRTILPHRQLEQEESDSLRQSALVGFGYTHSLVSDWSVRQERHKFPYKVMFRGG